MEGVGEQRGKRLRGIGITLEQNYIGVLHGEDSSYICRLLRLAVRRGHLRSRKVFTATLVASLSAQTARPEFFRFA